MSCLVLRCLCDLGPILGDPDVAGALVCLYVVSLVMDPWQSTRGHDGLWHLGVRWYLWLRKQPGSQCADR